MSRTPDPEMRAHIRRAAVLAERLSGKGANRRGARAVLQWLDDTDADPPPNLGLHTVPMLELMLQSSHDVEAIIALSGTDRHEALWLRGAAAYHNGNDCRASWTALHRSGWEAAAEWAGNCRIEGHGCEHCDNVPGEWHDPTCPDVTP